MFNTKLLTKTIFYFDYCAKQFVHTRRHYEVNNKNHDVIDDVSKTSDDRFLNKMT